MRKFARLRVCVVFLLLMGLLSPGPAALAAAPPGRVIFESGQSDANGIFEVSVTVYDLTAWCIQFVLRYDTSVIQPVKADGSPARSFDDFATLKTAWLDSIGTELDADIGLINFTYYVFPNNPAKEINSDGDIVTGSEGLPVYTFRFKRLKGGDTGLQIATEEKGEPFQDSCKNGIIALDAKGDISVDVIFQEAGKPDSGKTESSRPSGGGGGGGAAAPVKTVDGLLKEAVVLKIGSHAAVVTGGAVALYPGESMVTAYAHDNRTFVPLRFVGERLGATVDWDNDTRTAIVEKDGHRIEMPIGSTTFTLDGEEKTLDAPAELTPSTNGNARTMVPIRFVSEALGYQVEWDQARNLVIIAPASLSWDPKGTVEAQAMDKAVSTLLIFGNFV